MGYLKYTYEKVNFQSHGTKLAGILCTPKGEPGQKFPALTFLGPYTFIKEQAPFQYAPRFAQAGYVTLIFDPRTHGESEGEPRRWESPSRKAEDARAAIDYLCTLPQVDTNRIGAVAICQGAPAMMEAAAADPRIKALATENITGFVGGEEVYKERIARGDAAKAKFEKTGQADYLPIVDEERKDVGMPHKHIYSWYIAWVPKGWENRYTVMTDAEVLRWDAKIAARKVTCPYIMVHADRSDNNKKAREFYECVGSKAKKLEWSTEFSHMQYYENPLVIDHTVDVIDQWFRQNKL